jgi:hypothetical protein
VILKLFSSALRNEIRNTFIDQDTSITLENIFFSLAFFFCWLYLTYLTYTYDIFERKFSKAFKPIGIQVLLKCLVTIRKSANSWALAFIARSTFSPQWKNYSLQVVNTKEKVYKLLVKLFHHHIIWHTIYRQTVRKNGRKGDQGLGTRSGVK